jgi:hypothetical protein
MGQAPNAEPEPDDELRRQLDHARTASVLNRLGYLTPTGDELADVARLREDTARRQADPAVQDYLDDALRRLR